MPGSERRIEVRSVGAGIVTVMMPRIGATIDAQMAAKINTVISKYMLASRLQHQSMGILVCTSELREDV